MLLKGKRAVITGSSRGMGRAYAKALAAEGARVVVNGTTAALVHEVVGEIKAAGGEAVPCVESVASFEGAERVIKSCVEAFGGIDILINNAGVIAERMMFNMTDQEFRGPLNVDCYGTFACSRHAARDMMQRGWGRIINTGDGSPMHGALGGTNVAAAKGGIHAMTFTWAIELPRWGITVNCIIPGGYTRMHDPLYKKAIEVAQKRGDKDVPTLEEMVAKAVKPEETTPFLVYLCSDEAGWINGQIFTMNKGKISLWSHPVEKVQMLNPEGFTLE
ncbi:MAG: SDR family oxidoreductase, partial [Chloroflexi bacterium]|nr:SDR family oxidoreductase [Chloroflexota bacterium]